jgi:DNA-binding transcriptional LysR family regulator
MIDFKYRCVMTVAELQSFSKASEQLFVSQPYLSKAIASVEKELSIKIFDRSTNPITVTEAGRVYLRALKIMIHTEGKMMVKLKNLRDSSVSETISIGMGTSRSPYAAPIILNYMSKYYPDIDIRIVESDSNTELVKMVENGSIDMAFYTSPQLPNLVNAVHLGKEPFWLLLPATVSAKSLRDKNTLLKNDLQKLENYNFITLADETGLGQYIKVFFKKYSFTPKKISVVKNLDALQRIAAGGAGISIVPDLWKNKSRVLPVPHYFLIDDPPFSRDVYMIYSKKHSLTKIERIICGLAKVN